MPSDGAPETFYVVQTNNFGDIEALYTDDGTLVGGYSYDPYGAILNIDKKNDPNNILEKNPFRYRGYYYDTETGWYYLNSRYYDLVVKRFVSRDTAERITINYISAMQYNMFVYCDGNPINSKDDEGNCPQFLVGFAFGAGSVKKNAIRQTTEYAKNQGNINVMKDLGTYVTYLGKDEKKLFVRELFSDKQLPGNAGLAAGSAFGIFAGAIQEPLFNIMDNKLF